MKYLPKIGLNKGTLCFQAFRLNAIKITNGRFAIMVRASLSEETCGYVTTPISIDRSIDS